jgi:DNA-binding GntR family transcriptional regulator
MTSGRERAYEFLKDTVLSDPDMQGQFINEQEVADRIGVSRTPIREALLMLAAEDLIRLVPKKGAFVPSLSPKEIGDLFELRKVLECYAASEMIRRLRPDAMGGMLDAFAKQQELVRQPGKARKFIEQDRLFHAALVGSLGNQLFTRVYDGLRNRQIITGVTAVFVEEKRRQAVIDEHGAILGALRAGDTSLAQQTIVTHLDATLRVLLAR